MAGIESLLVEGEWVDGEAGGEADGEPAGSARLVVQMSSSAVAARVDGAGAASVSFLVALCLAARTRSFLAFTRDFFLLTGNSVWGGGGRK